MKVANFKVVSREEWGAKTPLRKYIPMPKIERIVIHHSATPSVDFTHPMTIQAIQKYHLSKDWNDIGYHFIFSPRGSFIYEGRPLTVLGAHCGVDINKERKSQRLFANSGSMGICVIGDYDKEKPSPELLDILKRFLNKFCAIQNIPLTSIYGHFEAWYPGEAKKTCPGKHLAIALFGENRWKAYFG